MAAREGEAPLARAEKVLRAFGAHPERWPDQDRAAVLGAAREALDVARVRHGEAALDRLLDRAPLHVPPAGLAARIQAAAMREPGARQHPPSHPLSRWQALLAALIDAAGRSLWRPAYALGGAVMLGIVAGSVWTPAAVEQVAAADFLSVAFARDFDSLDAGDFE